MKQVVQSQEIPYVFYTADAVPVTNFSWISDCWNAARVKMKVENLTDLILVIDEIQKINNWSEIEKRAIEVKSNENDWNTGLTEFNQAYKPSLSLVVGSGGMKAEDFLSLNPADLFK